MPKVNLLVSIERDHLDQFADIAKSMEDAGMDIAQQMKEIGVVTGSIDSENVERLRGLEGVSHIEEPRQFQIAPPDSDLQ